MTPIRSRERQASRPRGARGSVAWPIVVSVLLGLAIVAYTTSHLVRHRVMDHRFYVEALEEERVYDRLYQQILADPALASTVDPLLGGLPTARPLLVSVLRLVLPPDVIRGHIESAALDWERYLEGETERWQPRVDLEGLDRGIISFVNAYVAGRVAARPEQEVRSVPEFRQETDERLSDLSEGRLPDRVPALPVDDPAEADALAALIFAGARSPVPEERREQVAAALLVGDATEALALAVPAYLTAPLRDAASRWRGQLEGGERLNLVRSFEVMAGLAPGEAAETMEQIRTLTRLLGVHLAVGAAVVGVASLLGLLWMLPRRGRSPLPWLGATFLGASLVLAIVLLIVVRAFEAETDRRLATLPETFPPSGVVVLDDVASQLSAQLTAAAVPVLAGLAVLGAILLAGRWLLMRAHASLAWLQQRRWRIAVVAGGGVAALLLLAFAELGGTSGEELMRCNGQYELCDRRVDEVVFAGTHNSMAAADYGWIFPNHDFGIRAQLQAGFRALLLDTHYWDNTYVLPLGDRLSDEHQQKLIDLLLEIEPPRPGRFLCHASCSLGSAPLDYALVGIERFLRDHPNEVIILSFEDYITADDAREAFEASGLLDLVYRRGDDEEWPTLRELIERDQRVIVFADHHGGAFDWYLPFGDYVQDTPFNFSKSSEFSCAPNRGDSDASILMVNHWIASLPPDRAQAVLVNRWRPLMQRVEECREVRDMEPNILVVDFFAIGDTLRVVDELNRRER